MNPIARFVSQAEAELGGATRRLLDSVADPVRVKGHVIAAEASAVVSRLVRLVVIKGAFALLAAAMAIVALVYLATALHQALLPRFGPVDTRLIMAGVFLVAAGAAGLAMAFWPTGAPLAPAPDIAEEARRALAASAAPGAADAAAERVRVAAEQVREAADGAAGGERPSAAAATEGLRSGVESLAGVLGAAGFRREQAGLRAGMMLANQLKPLQLVSLALIGGFLAGMRTRRR